MQAKLFASPAAAGQAGLFDGTDTQETGPGAALLSLLRKLPLTLGRSGLTMAERFAIAVGEQRGFVKVDGRQITITPRGAAQLRG